MIFNKYDTTEAFGEAALETLLIDEEQNGIIIGFLRFPGDVTGKNWLLSTISGSDGAVMLVAACTPPHNLLIYERDNESNPDALKLLAETLLSLDYTVPGVQANTETATNFAKIYAGDKWKTHQRFNLMRLDTVVYEGAANGSARNLRPSDVYWNPYWRDQFIVDCNINERATIAEEAAAFLEKTDWTRYFVWEVNGIPVAIAANNRDTVHGANISQVYTPPYERGKGYATRIVSYISKQALMRKEYCILYADAANQISNHVYQKIGYRNICEVELIRFEMAAWVDSGKSAVVECTDDNN